MRIRNKVAMAGVIAGAAAMTALGGGVAQAANPERPTADYQLCGNVLDSNGAGVGGITVTGVVDTWSGTDVTAADGGYCLQGDATMESAVLGGSKVKLSAPGVDFGTWNTPGIDVWDFLTHVDSVYTKSAYGFNGLA